MRLNYFYIIKVCLIKMNSQNPILYLIKYPEILLFKQYIYFNKFISTYYNKYYYVYLKSTLTNKPTHWTLFSYTMDKYYTSINLNYKNTNAYFIKQSPLHLNKFDYIHSLINFKRLNTTFVSPQKLEDYSVINYYFFNKYQIENLYKNILPYTQNVLDNYLEIEDAELYNNTFNYKTKLVISENRKMLLNFLNFRIKRQYRITKFITKFIKFKVKNSINFFEMSLVNILLISKFIFNNNHCEHLFRNRCIYLNGEVITNSMKRLKTSDCVQLIFSKKYIDFFFNWFNNLSKLNLKYFNKFFKKFHDEKESSDTDTENSKTSRSNDNKKAQHLVIFKKPFPEFLEIDFLTLSIIVVYNPTTMYLLTNKSYYIYNHYLNRLYN